MKMTASLRPGSPACTLRGVKVVKAAALLR